MYHGKTAAIKDGWRIINNNQEHSIERTNLAGGSIKLSALASNPDKQDSLNANIIIADEIHAYKTPKQYNILKEATKAYTNKLVIGITTAGDDGTGFCAQRLAYCRKILSGSVKDDSYFVFICCADQDENGNVDYTDAIQHQKANPNYGVTIRPSDIMTDALQAQNDPQQRKDFLAKSLNIFTSSLRAYFNVDEFRHSNEVAGEKLGIDPAWTLEEKLDAIRRFPVQWYGGADLSKLHDLTAAALHGQYRGVDIVIPHCWFPVVMAAKKPTKMGSRYSAGWMMAGWTCVIHQLLITLMLLSGLKP